MAAQNMKSRVGDLGGSLRSFAAIMSAMILGGFAPALAQAAPRAGETCAAFMEGYPKALSTFRVSFERPLTITRDLSGGEDGIDVHILSTNAEVDGTLKCKGDAFRRFELRVAASADAETEAHFAQFQQAALSAFFGLDPTKAATIVQAMSADADEYLRASIQREDTYHAGKVEYHQGTRFDLGLIWTEADRTFIVTTQDEP